MTLYAKTLDLLKNRRRTLTLKEISEKTNTTEAWLSKFVNGHIENPSVHLVEAIFNFLTNDQLQDFLNDK